MELPAFLKVDIPQPTSNAPLPYFGWRPPHWHPQDTPPPVEPQPIESTHSPQRRAPVEPDGPTPAEVKARMLAQFEAVFPRLMDRVYAGDTLSRAVEELPMGFRIDYGQFNKWVMRDPKRKAIYEEAKEYRTEVWADRMVAHAEGEVGPNGEPRTIERSKYATDVYKFLMSRHNKRTYGETKTLEVEHRISIRSALEQAQQRVIEATVIEPYVPEDDEDIRMLMAAESEEDEDD